MDCVELSLITSNAHHMRTASNPKKNVKREKRKTAK